MKEQLEKMSRDVAQQRSEIIDKLVQFSLTDLLLFWGTDKDLIARQEAQWGPLLQWVKEELDSPFVKTQGLEVPEENKEVGYRLKRFLEGLSDKELTAFYSAALDMRSVLLAAALVKGRINADEAFRAAFLEELWQSENWGTVDDAEQKRMELKQELVEIEKFLKS